MKKKEQTEQENVQLPEEELASFDLDDILREFGSGSLDPEPVPEPEEAQPQPAPEIAFPEEPAPEPEAEVQVYAAPEAPAEPVPVPEETVRINDLHQELGDTVRFDSGEQKVLQNAVKNAAPVAEPEETEAPQKEEPFSEKWEPEYEQPMGEYIPPQPIVFRPRSRLRELKRKLVAGPEKRYYELAEIGLGRLQAAIFLSAIVALAAAGMLVLHGLDMVRPDRMRLLVFGQVLGMLLAGLLGSYQLLRGIGNLFHGRMTADTMLFFTFIACCVDSVICLQQLRVPYCAAFSLEVTMSLWAEYQRRNTEIGQMDTLRKATRLDSVVKVPEFYDGRPGLLRSEGQVEDFMDHYHQPSTPEKVFSRFMLAGLVLSIAIGVAGGVLHREYQMGIRLGTAAMLAMLPATAFIAHSRPGAVLQRRLHQVGSVICGWKGVKGLRKSAVIPVSDRDLFPAGSIKMNGVKFFGSREPDQVMAYAAALVMAEGTGLASLFSQLLDGRNGRHYDAENFRVYNGGLGGEVNGEPVLIGSHSFLRDMGVEVPEGTRVHQALYAAIDGELGGVFAITYGKVRNTAVGMGALCGYRSLTPVLTCGDFMITESFVRSKFHVNARRVAFPPHDVRKELEAKTPSADAQALALMTKEGMMGMAIAITGARSLRSATICGTVLHMVAGIIGLVIVGLLAAVGAEELLTAENLMLFELLWLIPGVLITEWTRST